MAHIKLLERVEDFLIKDLHTESLNAKNSVKRLQLAAKIREAIEEIKSANKLEKFLEQQRSNSRASLDFANLPLPKVPEPSRLNGPVEEEEEIPQEDLYMDLNEEGFSESNSGPSNLSVQGPSDTGSASGYESYPSDDEQTSSKTNSHKDDIVKYYTGTNCDVYSYVFLENKTLFSGKKWNKRIGIVKENHFQCFKKLGDSQAILDLPLGSYSAHLCNRDGRKLIVTLESSGSQDEEGYRFYVSAEKADEWSRVLREKSASVVDMGSLPAPPVASRPSASLPNKDRPMNRQASMTVTDSPHGMPQISVNDGPFRASDDVQAWLNPLAPAAKNSFAQDFGKGLKNAFTGLTNQKKKEKAKKKRTPAEELGADLCGDLEVCVESKWSKKFCLIKNNELQVYGKDEWPEITVALQGSDLHPYFEDPERRFSFKLMKRKMDVLLLSASTSDDMGRWIGKLIAETGCAAIPEHTETAESVYVEPEVISSVMSRAREVFQQTVKVKKERMMEKKAKQGDAIEQESESAYVDMEPPVASNVSSKANKNPDKSSASPTATGASKAAEPVPLMRTKKHIRNASDQHSKHKSESYAVPTPSRPPTHFDYKKRAVSEPAGFQTKKTGVMEMKVNVVSCSGGVTLSDANIQYKVAEKSNRVASEQEKETEKRVEEVNTRLRDLRVKKKELAKYLDAAQTAKEKSSVDTLYKNVHTEMQKLEAEKIDLDVKLKKFSDAEATGNKRSYQQRPAGKSAESAGPGNVMSRAKMFENL